VGSHFGTADSHWQTLTTIVKGKKFQEQQNYLPIRKQNVVVINTPGQVSYLTGLMLERTNFQIKANAEF